MSSLSLSQETWLQVYAAFVSQDGGPAMDSMSESSQPSSVSESSMEAAPDASSSPERSMGSEANDAPGPAGGSPIAATAIETPSVETRSAEGSSNAVIPVESSDSPPPVAASRAESEAVPPPQVAPVASPVVAIQRPLEPVPLDGPPTQLAGPTDRSYPPSARVDERFRVARHVATRDGRTLVSVVDEGGRRATLQIVPSSLTELAGARSCLEGSIGLTRAIGLTTVPEVRAIGRTLDAHSYIELPAMEAQSLTDVVSRGGFQLDDACRIIVSIARALDAAHRQGVVHGDVRASNVLVVTEGSAPSIRLVGFGLDGAERAVQATSDARGEFVRSPGYWAPERVSDPTRVDATADQYALGCLAFEILTGAGPFAGDDWGKLLLHHVRSAPPSVRSILPDIPEAVAGIVARSLAKVPSQRFASCAEFADRLEAARYEPRAQAAPAPSPLPRPRSTGARTGVSSSGTGLPYAAAAGVGFVLVATVALLSHSRNVEDDSVDEIYTPTTIGTVHVESEPPGASIWIDGALSDSKTPAAIPGAEVGRPVRVRVELPGYVARPEEMTVRISEFIPSATARFALLPAKVFRIESTPPGARVVLDGERVQGVTPLDLPPLVMGTSGTVEVSLADYEPGRIELEVRRDGPSIRHVALEPLVELAVKSVPPRAEVRIDGTQIGHTPIKAHRVPKNRPFELTVMREGFETIRRVVTVGKLPEPELRFDLEPVGTPVDRPATLVEISKLEARLSKVQARVAVARQRLADAERKLEVLEKNPEIHVSIKAEAQNLCDDRERELNEVELEASRITDSLEELKTSAGL
ncbi:MAG: PEGA domain-containing protein [Deltaproteobacteria bacterium]|nr:PEGA domain-containing protein [Deltaproteobacteria bacterium]